MSRQTTILELRILRAEASIIRNKETLKRGRFVTRDERAKLRIKIDEAKVKIKKLREELRCLLFKMSQQN